MIFFMLILLSSSIIAPPVSSRLKKSFNNQEFHTLTSWEKKLYLKYMNQKNEDEFLKGFDDAFKHKYEEPTYSESMDRQREMNKKFMESEQKIMQKEFSHKHSLLGNMMYNNYFLNTIKKVWNFEWQIPHSYQQLLIKSSLAVREKENALENLKIQRRHKDQDNPEWWVQQIPVIKDKALLNQN